MSAQWTRPCPRDSNIFLQNNLIILLLAKLFPKNKCFRISINWLYHIPFLQLLSTNKILPRMLKDYHHNLSCLSKWLDLHTWRRCKRYIRKRCTNTCQHNCIISYRVECDSTKANGIECNERVRQSVRSVCFA